MKKIRPVVVVSVALSLGAVVASCLSFSSNPDNTGGVGGSGDPGGVGGSTGTSDLGGSTGTTPTGGSTGTTPTGGSTGTTPTGGSTGTTPTGGSTGTGGGAGRTGTGGATGAGGATVASGPCDLLATAGNPCVAAHSTVRALYTAYTGPLYQVCRGASAPGPASCPGNVTMDIGVVAGGYANAAAQDTFCAGSTCTISIIYDQSPNGNLLKPAPRGGAKGTPDNPAVATDLRTTINGHAVYGVFVKPGIGYRAGCTGCGTPVPHLTATGDQPETEYMVTSLLGLTNANGINGCCFDYGNAETTSNDDGNGTMEALYYGGGVVWGTGSPGGHNNGPWIMADLENGLYAGWQNNQDQNITTNTPLRSAFVTGVLVGDVAARNAGAGRFALYGGDATTGALITLYDGIRPAKAGYVPMRKQGSIILGIGGDNSGGGGGQWFEGVMASGAATVQTINAIQTNVVAAGYGK